LVDSQENLLKRLYYNKNEVSPKRNQRITKKFSMPQMDINSRIEELDKSLKMKNIQDKINRIVNDKEKKLMLKNILRKHYLSI
jgi:hypothetical protein